MLNWILFHSSCQTCIAYVVTIFILTIVPKIKKNSMFVWKEDAIAFIQQYHQGQAIYCLKKSGLSMCVRLSGGPCDEFLRVGCRGLNPMRKHNLSSRLAVFCWACIFADQTGHRKKSKAGSWRLYFSFLKHVCKSGFESRSNVKKWCWNPSVIYSSCWRSVFITDFISAATSQYLQPVIQSGKKTEENMFP